MSNEITISIENAAEILAGLYKQGIKFTAVESPTGSSIVITMTGF